ncbi:MAG TPA: lipid-A-disaccharide synthase [Candidatus Kapabacteria bacterium]|nr:lipid-A-disaccharide synthase [Candidatus Kapabacteria bacterium]
MKNIFISAGDPSADRHTANLMKELKIRVPDIKFFGIGGPLAENEGLISLAPFSEISVVGFWEVAKKFSYFTKLLDRSKHILQSEKIDVYIPVDYPGFNLRLAKHAKHLKIPTIYYIAPQLWAWGKQRAKHLADCIDKILVVFPFEEDYFKNFGIDTKFVGHPLLDYPQFNLKFNTYSERHNEIAILPGSRKQELLHHKQFLNSLYESLSRKLPDYELVIAKSPNLPDSFYNSINSNFKIHHNSNELMLNAKAGIIKTGTSNLEAMLSGLPFGMFYMTSFLTYIMAKKMINLPYISIVNILKNAPVIPEFIQNKAKPIDITNYISSLISNEEKYYEIQSTFDKLRQELGTSGAAKTAANEIIAYL